MWSPSHWTTREVPNTSYFQREEGREEGKKEGMEEGRGNVGKKEEKEDRREKNGQFDE